MRVWPSPAIEAALHAERERSGEPLCAYAYDLDALRDHARKTRDAMPDGAELFYAIKANAEPELLATLDGIVDGFEVASGGELAWMRTHRGRAARILFGGPGKLDTELAAAIAEGVELIHVESLGELRRLAALTGTREVPIALRINPMLDPATRTRLMMAGGASPFGIDEDQLGDCLDLVHNTPTLGLRGFHIHALSHHLDMAAHADLLALYLDRFEEWRHRFGLSVDSLNMGGGIGIDYAALDRQPDWAGLMLGLADRLAAIRRPPQVRFELGRYLAAGCGFYAAEIIDLKRSRGEWFAVCRGGTHHFRTPSAQQHSHPVYILDGERGDDAIVGEACTFVGQLCTPKDVFARGVPCSRLAVGDIAIFPLAGAYAWTISHHDFLKHRPPARLFVGATGPVPGEKHVDVAA